MSSILKRGTENVLETRLAKVLEDLGHQSIHNDPSLMKGIPDRYVMGAGGLWIEVKRARGWSTLYKDFDRQRTFLDFLHEENEKAWVCALLDAEPYRNEHPLLWFEPWSHFKGRDAGLFKSTALSSWDRHSPYKVPTYDALDEALVAGFKKAAL